MGARPGRICFVVLEHNRGLETSYREPESLSLAQLLAGNGWEVHVLLCRQEKTGDHDAGAGSNPGLHGLKVHRLEERAFPAVLDAPFWYWPFDQLSQKVRLALEQLHREHGYDLVQFAEYRGLGIRSIQAKRAGLALEDVALLVRLQGMSQRRREDGYRWMDDNTALIQDFCERDSFEHADGQISSSRSLRDYARKLGWRISENVEVVPDPLEDRAAATLPTEREGPPELVFVGRYEPNSGLKLFLRAIANVSPDLPVTFIGWDMDLGDEVRGSELIQAQLAGREVRLLDQLDWEQAKAYLKARHRLAVFPSLYGPIYQLVAECACNDIPFLASAIDGVEEIAAESDLRQALFFKPSPPALHKCLNSYLNAAPAQRRDWYTRVANSCRLREHNERILAYYQRAGEHSRTAGGPLLPGCRSPIEATRHGCRAALQPGSLFARHTGIHRCSDISTSASPGRR